ncbi:receptor-like protein EIX1 [Ziziphus jujuba]|uniref:Receptor-like protein EIX1 n=1 Tax=Ziziphus jujuba TaxID=326968 RepID=A0A6P4BF32_ZIZJJ|nr:receptor-like protein EIX1 [Ziziphus jujuba]
MSATYLLQTVSRIPSILELHLPSCQLSDRPLTLPFHFTSLSVLDLSNNGFKSTIPDWLFNLRSLVKLDLSNNHFHGEIPDAISNLAFLERLDLSGNSIGGKLSRNLGKLCNLRSMELYDNKIFGEIVDYFDSLSECFSNKLETLDLGDNGVMGKLPDALGYIKSLRFLRLSNNSLQRLLPCSIGNLKSLQKILLGDNRMSIIPENLGQLSKLVVLDISESIWEGILTEAHLMNLSGLKKLVISCSNQSPNNISLVFNISFDWIPPFKLKYLSIKSCQLGPKFPTWLQNQDELSTLSLINASISDTIPNWFWQMDVKLDMLDLSYNNIGGRVFSSLSFNKHSSMYLISNHFDGLFPVLASNITTLYLSINQFLKQCHCSPL